MEKKVLLLCNDNSRLSILSAAILNKYLKGVQATSAATKKAKPVNVELKKALQKDGSWSDDIQAKSIKELQNFDFDLVIVLDAYYRKNLPEFPLNTTVIEIEYDEPNYESPAQLERFIKTIKMEIIPITRDILEL